MLAMNFRMIDKGHDLKILWQVVVYILIEIEKFQILYFVNALIAFLNFVNPIKLVTPRLI